MDKFAYIDRARAIAILMVVAVHTSQSVPNLSWPFAIATAYGQMGVQLFFVASALTLSLSWTRRTDGAASFYVRRFFRIAPLYYIGIVLYWIASVLKGQGFASEKQVLANVFLFHGFIPSANNNVVPGGWSIGTEVAFYAIFPLLFPASQYAVKRYGQRALLTLLIGAIVIDYAYLDIAARFGQPISNNSFAYFSIFNQLPVFIVGIAAFHLLNEGSLQRPSYLRDLFGFSIGTACGLYLLIAGTSVSYMVLPAVAAISFIFLLRLLSAPVFDRARWLGRVGQLSYSVYIFHFVFAWDVGGAIVSRMGESASPDLLFGCLFLASMAASLSVASLTERLIEKPGIALGARLLRR
jgi:peptidoglycan/LPS O-acetylase OafA/YrhL